MIACFLFVLRAAEVLILTLAAVWAVRAGLLHPASAIVLAVAVFLVLVSLPLATVYLVALVFGPRAPAGRRVLGVLGEWLAYLALFIFIQPLARLWMGAEPAGLLPAGQVPVVLVHGYLCNRGFWWCLRRALREHGFAVATIDLEPPFAGIDRLADALHRRIEALRAETGAERVVLIGHSMGGLVARAYLRRHGSAHVDRLVTLGSPHHGSRIAWLVHGRNAREMRPNSAWLGALNAHEPAVPVLSIWSPHDEFVVPPDSARLAGAREIVVPSLGHLAMAFAPGIRARVLAELAAPR
ncbi:MAG TPA: alpha/beta fold hydrolase [Xanthobacteraceae bacterium]|nr:alpha/beta fold hydrolase [Xanthobacteraceae bacterium]